MKKAALALITLTALGAQATPSTTFWAPSTTAVQPFLVPHITYDTYFWKGTTPGQAGSPVYPITTGLTMGVLPWENLQLEVGFDVLLPSSDPLLFNAKLGVPEDKLFPFQPSVAVGIFGVGTKGTTNTELGTDYDILYAQVQHTIPSVGGYVYLPWLLKMNVTADVQTGKNVYGAAGGGLYFYFTDKVDLLTGPVYFFDPASQPGGRQWFWTVQLDVDLPLRPSPPAAAAPAPPATKAEAAPAPSDGKASTASSK